MNDTTKTLENEDPIAINFFGIMFTAANEKGHSVPELAAELGVTYGYLQQLRMGLRSMDAVNITFARKSADYAGVRVDDLFLPTGTRH